jgi:hypothetical protein
MIFSYKITEADFVAAQKLRSRKTRSSSKPKAFIFWPILFVGIVAVWIVVNQTLRPAPVHHDDPFVLRGSGPAFFVKAFLISQGPFWAIAGAGMIAGYFMLRTSARKVYGKSGLMQKEFTVEITPNSFTSTSSSGSHSHSIWRDFEFWREAGSLVLLVRSVGTFSILNVAGLSAVQREELRSVLQSALPEG